MTEYERGRREGHRLGLEDGRASARTRERIILYLCIMALGLAGMWLL